MHRAPNFNAGPAALPTEVLQEAAANMLDFNGTGMSVMELSHRGKDFKGIIETAEADLRDLLAIPANYRVLFLQGGGTQQFAAVPMNLMRTGVADYIVTGAWSKKAQAEARMYGTANIVASSADANFSYTPDCDDLPVSPDASYVYFCQNETIHGTRFTKLPDPKGKPLVADVSSCFLSEPMDVSKYGLIWGGVQKNVGPAGCVIVIVRDDLVTDDVWPGTPTILRYKTQADAGSLYNTPPCWSIYICGLVFKWIKGLGGLDAMAQINRQKAQRLYTFLDSSSLFHGAARPDCRSIMNVTFFTGDPELDARFCSEAAAAGFVGIKGHRSVGGMRASIYNAVTLQNVEDLVSFMERFERDNAKAARPAGDAGCPEASASCSSSSQSM